MDKKKKWGLIGIGVSSAIILVGVYKVNQTVIKEEKAQLKVNHKAMPQKNLADVLPEKEESIHSNTLEPVYDMAEDMTQEKKERVINQVIEAAEVYKDIYQTANKGTASNVVVSQETVKAIIERLGKQGYATYGCYNDINLKNYDKVESFFEKVANKEKAEVNIYEVNHSGGFNQLTLETMGGQITGIVVNMEWNEEFEPKITYLSQEHIAKWEYTSKGYLIYQYGASKSREYSVYQMIRVKPLDQACLELNQQYIATIGYQGNNLFLTDWDEKDWGKLDFNDLYEYLYMINFGKRVESEAIYGGVAKEVFEPLIQKYFNISTEKLEEVAHYNNESKEYTWYPLGCANYTPTPTGVPRPEIIEIKNNLDGTQVLIVDAIWEEIGTECAFRHEVTIRRKDDGSIEFVGNKIQEDTIYDLPRYVSRNDCALKVGEKGK